MQYYNISLVLTKDNELGEKLNMQLYNVLLTLKHTHTVNMLSSVFCKINRNHLHTSKCKLYTNYYYKSQYVVCDDL